MKSVRKHYTQMSKAELNKCDRLLKQIKKVCYTKHAYSRMRTKHISKGQVNHVLATGHIIEFERVYSFYGVNPRLVVRGHVSNKDVCVVVGLDGFIKTAWVNSASDNHATLDLSKYEAQMVI